MRLRLPNPETISRHSIAADLSLSLTTHLGKRYAESEDPLMSVNRDETVLVEFTGEEAWELLSRCLASATPDGPVMSEAIRKLARALAADPDPDPDRASMR